MPLSRQPVKKIQSLHLKTYRKLGATKNVVDRNNHLLLLELSVSKGRILLTVQGVGCVWCLRNHHNILIRASFYVTQRSKIKLSHDAIKGTRMSHDSMNSSRMTVNDITVKHWALSREYISTGNSYSLIILTPDASQCGAREL